MLIADAIPKLSCIYYNATSSLAEARAYKILCDLKRLKDIQKRSLQYLIVLRRLPQCVTDEYMCEVEDYISVINKDKIYSCLVTPNCTDVVSKICNIVVTDVTPYPVCVDYNINEL